mgnify:CR=1 FL=1
MITTESILEELALIKVQQETDASTDVIQRTITNLIGVEKKSMYGVVRGKNKIIDEIINKEFPAWLESK